MPHSTFYILHSTPARSGRAGFTLIEILVASAVLLVLFGSAAVFGFSSYRRQMIVSERDNLVAVLGQARSLSLANVRQSDHGVYLAGGDYVLFEGSAYASRNSSYDRTYPKSGSLTLTGPSEVVFHRLSGEVASTGTIGIVNGSTTLNIWLGSAGSINW